MLCDPIVMVGYVGERGGSTMSVDSIVRRVVDHSLANIVYSLMTVLISWLHHFRYVVFVQRVADH